MKDLLMQLQTVFSGKRKIICFHIWIALFCPIKKGIMGQEAEPRLSLGLYEHVALEVYRMTNCLNKQIHKVHNGRFQEMSSLYSNCKQKNRNSQKYRVLPSK